MTESSSSNARSTIDSITRIRSLMLVMICGVLLGACANSQIESTHASLTVACAAPKDMPGGAWVCPAARTLHCDELATTTLYIAEGDPLACEQQAVTLLSDGIFTPGTQVVTVQSDNGEVCDAELTLIDETLPVLVSHTLNLWPPNHMLHTIDMSDCVTAIDDCDGPISADFIWASSDEPVDDTGDGMNTPDIVIADNCQRISVRAERQGAGDGRVYTLGVRVFDTSGNSAETVCSVVVDHDQGDHVTANSGEAYRLTFDGSDSTPNCTLVTSP